MAESNAARARRFFEEVWNERNAAAFIELVHADGLAHHTTGELSSIEEFLDVVHSRFLGAFPDLKIQVEGVIGEGDDAVVRWFATGTHLGDGLGVLASKQSIGFRGMTWFRFRDGKIAEGWDCWDHGGLLQALWRGAPPDSAADGTNR